MKKFVLLTTFIFIILNCTIAGVNDSTMNKTPIMFYIKGSIGKLIPFNSSNPSISESDIYSTSYTIGAINKSKDMVLYTGLEYEYLNSKILNTDTKLGSNFDYKINGYFFKFLFQYNLTAKFHIMYNIGMGSLSCSRPLIVLPPSNISGNGKLIEEYPIKQSNNAFITGLGIDYSVLKWLSIKANCDYIGTTFNFNNVVHSENKLVTSVYDTDLELRAVYISMGIIIHTPFK